MTFILFIALCVFTYFAPEIFWGITYADLIELLQTENLQEFSEIMKTFGLTEQTVNQFVYSKIAICAGIFIGGIIVIIILSRVLSKNKGK